MKQLEKKLKDLQKRGYETITINQVLIWIHQIRMDNREKRLLTKEEQ